MSLFHKTHHRHKPGQPQQPGTAPGGSPGKIDEQERKSLLRLLQAEEKRSTDIARKLKEMHNLLQRPNVTEKEFQVLSKDAQHCHREGDAFMRHMTEFQNNLRKAHKT